jgi:acetyltransferase
MKQKSSMEKLLRPRSIAIVGATETSGKVGQLIAANVIADGYKGTVYYINPKYETLNGRPCYPSLQSVGVDIDCAIIAVPAEYVHDVIADGSGVCQNFVVISAGFGETDIIGHKREMALQALVKEKDITVLGPNCLGFLMPSLRLNASFAPDLPQEGSVALISQSGALAVAAMDRAREDHSGFSGVVSIGNKMHLDAAEFITYFSHDPATRMIALYLEGVVHGPRFLRAVAQAVQSGTSVVVLKAGRTDAAQKAITLHTGALAGSDAIFGAALEKAGAVRLQSMEELFVAMSYAAHHGEINAKRLRVGVVTNAGGPGVLATDVIDALPHMRMAHFDDRTKEVLTKKLPHAASVHNPVDLLGDADHDRYAAGISAMLSDKNVDALVVLLTPQDNTPVMDIAQLIITKQKRSKKLIIASFIGGERIQEAVALLRKNGVLHFTSIHTALHTINTLLPKQRIFSLKKASRSLERPEAVSAILSKIDGRTVLYFDEVRAIARIYDMPVIAFHDITDGLSAQMQIQYPCVAKIDAPDVLHKTDRGGVILPIARLKELTSARTELLRRFPQKDSRVIVQALRPIQMELIIGMTRDPVFGVIVVVGIGGVYTEIIRASDIYIAPVATAEVEYKLTHGAIHFLFDGTRGIAPYDKKAVAHMVTQMMAIGLENPAIKSIDINPFLVYNDDRKSVVVDMKITI